MKRLLWLLLLAAPLAHATPAAQQVIFCNISTLAPCTSTWSTYANLGDPAARAFGKTNSNVAALFDMFGTSSNLSTNGVADSADIVGLFSGGAGCTGTNLLAANGTCQSGPPSPFSQITGGTNLTAAMLVGTGASLGYTGTGILNASEITGLAWPSLVASDCLTNNGTALSWGTCGSGSVNSGTAGDLSYYATTGTAVSDLPLGNGFTTSGGVLQAVYSINAQTGTTYTIATTDFSKLITFSNAAAVAVTLPQATGSFAGASFDVQNLGAGLATITPTTSTINGLASLSLETNLGCSITSDGTNYQTSACPALIPYTALTWNAAQTYTNSDIRLLGSSTGYTTFTSANASATNYTVTVPAITDTIVTLTATQTLTNKSIAATEVNSGTLAAAQMPALTGDVTSTAGTVATTVVKVNGASVPASAPAVATNSSSQLVAATTVTYPLDYGTQYTVSGTGACATIVKTGTTGTAAGKFQCTGTTGASTITITLPAATNGWSCEAHDVTTIADTLAEGVGTTTTDTFSSTATAANDYIKFNCTGF